MTDKHPIERKDPLIDEVRKLRAELSRQYDDDLSQLFEHLHEVQQSMPNPIVRRESIQPQTERRAAG